MKRVFLVVLDSMGIGNAADAEKFGDSGANTLKSCYNTGCLKVTNMQKIGLFNIDGVDYGEKATSTIGAYGRMKEKSMGKDTTIGHWEIAGVISEKPLPTYPDGFPQEIISKFIEATGREVLCNKAYSGTEVIRDYGRKHMETGALIVYTSADSVFQIAAHESIVPPEKLYEYCETAREILVGKHGVGRVIARPFEGEYPFKRTSRRHDFSINPPCETMLDVLKNAGKDVIAVGKINDIFAGRGITEFVCTSGNDDGMAKTVDYAKRDFEGLCFVNLVDFDMAYGHRRDAAGYTEALNRFDEQLGRLMSLLGDDDVLMITADHGCDPCFKGTDHTRENVPLLIYGKNVPKINLGTTETYADCGTQVLKILGVDGNIRGNLLY